MKKIYLTIVLLCTVFFFATAQVQPAISDIDEISYTDSIHITFTDWRDSIFGQLDKTPITSGYLTEYSLMPFDSLRWDGEGTDNDTIYYASEYFLLYNILQASTVNADADLEDVDNQYDQAKSIYNNNSEVPLLFLYHDYQRIRKTALDENLLQLAPDSVQILDVPGRSRNPYNTYQIFTFSPFKTNINQFDALTFSAPATLWNMNGITSVQVDFGDGSGYHTLTPGATESIYYAEEGDKILTAKISTATGIRYARCMLHYSRPEYFYKPDTTWDIEVPPVIGGGSMAQEAAPNGSIFPYGIQTVGANVEVVNGCDQNFNNPIIVVEGFDPTNDMATEDLGDMFQSFYFEDYLQSLGYDFVFVDFKNNTTYIENNAKMIEAVINKVNQIKNGNNELNIIGYSMGGLVVRYCLADMENRGVAHHVANFFSYDAPHQGANIPLGLQFLFLDLQDDMPYLSLKFIGGDFGNLVKAFASPAAREMLVKHADYGPPGHIAVNDALRISFAQKLLNKGYPTQCNNYALAYGRGDGIGNGTQFGYNSGDKILDASLSYFLVNFQAKAYAVQEGGVKDYILRYRFEGIKPIRIFGAYIPLPVPLKVRNIKYRGVYPYEVAPGSNENTQLQFADQIDSNLLLGIGHGTTEGHDAHCFVPAVSALDLKNQGYGSGDGYLSDNIYYKVDNQITNIGAVDGNTISSSLSPFQAVITSTSNGNLGGNLPHGSDLNQTFGDFIIRKITNANPNFNCLANSFCNRNLSISGSNVVCTDGTYSISNIPNGVNINWTFSNGNLKIINGQGTNSIMVSTISSGNDTVKAILTSPCGAVLTITKAIHSGVPDRPKAFDDFGNEIRTIIACTNIHKHIHMSEPLYGILEWKWEKVSGSFHLLASGRNAQIIGFTPTSGLISVQAKNACGWSVPDLIMVLINSCGQPFTQNAYLFSISPNPASKTINITTDFTDKQYSKVGETGGNGFIKEVKIYTSSGKLVKQQLFSGNSSRVQMNVSSLTPSIYFVEISDGRHTDTHKLVIGKYRVLDK